VGGIVGKKKTPDPKKKGRQSLGNNTSKKLGEFHFSKPKHLTRELDQEYLCSESKTDSHRIQE